MLMEITIGLLVKALLYALITINKLRKEVKETQVRENDLLQSLGRVAEGVCSVYLDDDNAIVVEKKQFTMVDLSGYRNKKGD